MSDGILSDNKCCVCSKKINLTNHHLKCDFCHSKIHKRCNKLNDIDYQVLQSRSSYWFCILCIKDLIPFSDISDQELRLINSSDVIVDFNKLPSSLNIFPAPIKNNYFKKFNDYFVSKDLDNNEDDDGDISNLIKCKYFNVDDFCSSNFDSSNSFSVFHLNIASLKAHFDELNTMLNLLDFNFSVIGLTETKIKKDIHSIVPISIKGYSCEHTPTESACGGALLYISDGLHYKPRNDLLIYKSCICLNLSLLRFLCPKKSNIIVGCIYKHPSMSITEFVDLYFSPVLEKISHEKKSIIILGDFNIDLIKCSSDEKISDYFNLISSYNLLPFITLPTRITGHSKTLIDNIFSNCTDPQIISGNLTSTISDHLPQFFIYPGMNKNFIPRKHNIYRRSLINYDKNELLSDFKNLDWEVISKINDNDTNKSFNLFFSEINSLLDISYPTQKAQYQELQA